MLGWEHAKFLHGGDGSGKERMIQWLQWGGQGWKREEPWLILDWLTLGEDRQRYANTGHVGSSAAAWGVGGEHQTHTQHWLLCAWAKWHATVTPGSTDSSVPKARMLMWITKAGQAERWAEKKKFPIAKREEPVAPQQQSSFPSSL